MVTLKVHGSIRIRCINIGTSKWKEGSFEIVEKEGKACLVVTYNAGGIPSTFKLSQNIKSVFLRNSGVKMSRLMMTLKDSSNLMIDRVAPSIAQDMHKLLLTISQENNRTEDTCGKRHFSRSGNGRNRENPLRQAGSWPLESPMEKEKQRPEEKDYSTFQSASQPSQEFNRSDPISDFVREEDIIEEVMPLVTSLPSLLPCTDPPELMPPSMEHLNTPVKGHCSGTTDPKYCKSGAVVTTLCGRQTN